MSKQNKKTSLFEPFINGLMKENPTFVLMLGLCPTLAVTTSASNALGMGLSSTAVLVMSNLLISALRNIIPDKVRMPAYIVIVASFVTIVQFILQGYAPGIYESLGIYIPLIVVNCIILGRAEAYANQNTVGLSIMDGIGMGFGFTIGLFLIGTFREVLGAGTVMGFKVTPEAFEPANIFVLAPGAFFVLSILTALQNKFKLKSATNGSVPRSGLACGGDCLSCHGGTCEDNREKLEASKTVAAKNKKED
ncbi:electron transport complex subunit E [Anaerocolumna aminovalerica]|jgi:electron transport complex protein RnfE|uniref:Ion-translocating oxidoreductase complex subunit E n=1 Tax=Anaerocolumna aminovalerica TaxID=1527 RepID=A0A1I5HCS9_9FIRM|nr:electron transport complex subunit E [Anaerocolumna aminovalerica]MBU5332472.1 electron transport complex subunit E [Anaerocolumna aminovalerica]MDU6265309.1 electron transport complex subunit E [Anaerocolumna aminovalerica]SFO45816.1 electron transport complex protein RnfE [Anaerocolumna aminovalerica]